MKQIFKVNVVAPKFEGDGSLLTNVNPSQAPTGTNGQLLIGQTGTSAAFKTVSGDFTIDQNGAATLNPARRKVATVTLSAADILALNGSPKALVATPGSGKVLVIEKVLIQFKHTSTNYLAGGTVAVVYTGQTTALTAALLAAVFLANADSITALGALAAATNGQTLLANTGLSLYNAGSEFTTGTGTAVVTVWYTVVTLG